MSGAADVLARLPVLAQLAGAQACVLHRAQLREHGVGADAVAYQVLARRWQVVGPLVVVVHTGPLTPLARRWAAVLSGGPGAALGAWTALHQWGLQG